MHCHAVRLRVSSCRRISEQRRAAAKRVLPPEGDAAVRRLGGRAHGRATLGDPVRLQPGAERVSRSERALAVQERPARSGDGLLDGSFRLIFQQKTEYSSLIFCECFQRKVGRRWRWSVGGRIRARLAHPANSGDSEPASDAENNKDSRSKTRE